MRPKGVLLPLLHEPAWTGASYAVVRPLVPGDRASPWVAYAYDTGTQRLTITPLGLAEEDRTAEAVEAEAVKNLAARDLRFGEASGGVLTLVDEYASSGLVSRAVLGAARERLGGDLLLATPMRGLLVAARAPAEGDLGLGAWASRTYGAALDDRITERLFRWNGERLALEPARVRPPSEGRLDLLAYDEDEERADLVVLGPFDPQVEANVKRIARGGRLDPTRPVSELRIVFATRSDAALHAESLAASGAVACYRDAGGALVVLG